MKEILLQIYKKLEKLETCLLLALKGDYKNFNKFIKEISNLEKDFLTIKKDLEGLNKIEFSQENIKLIKNIQKKLLKVNILFEKVTTFIQKEIKFFEREAKKHKAFFINKEV